ncbi:serine/threonine-protein kinase [Sorangium sp. So ce1128]
MLSGRLLDGRFELAEVAGCGGMGTVYRALDRASGTVVALKLLHKVDARAQARFDREARALSRMEHPHIVRYATHGVAPTGEPYLAMEWLSGESLAARLSRQELRLEESVALARAVADALGAAHARGIVHRDIKPSNLFLVDGVLDRVKVIDFGIAQLPDATSRLTQTAAVVGTLGYMAPEQARGDQETLDARADIFSLGCVLFECLTGQRAFRAQHVAALVWKLLLEEPPRARALRPAVPEALDELLARMLAKDASARPGDGAAVARCLDALGALERGGALDESGVAPDPPLGEVITTGERRHALVPLVRTMLLSSMAELRLRQGRAGEAVAFAREALDWDRRAGAVFAPRQESLPAIYAEALHASGDAEAAREVIRAARDELLARADRIGDPAFRRGFLENVSANARTLALASAWLGEGSSPAPHGAE